MRKRQGLIIGFILLGCVCLIFLKNFFSNKLYNDSTYGMPALIESGQVDNLFIGSSMFRQGIDIEELNYSFENENNYILSYNGNQPIWEYLQLKYLLENEVKIDSLYVDMYVYSAWEAPELDDEKMFHEFDFQNKKWLYNNLSKSNSIKDWWQLWVSSNNEMFLFWPVYTHLVNSQFFQGGALTNVQAATYEQLEAQSGYSIKGSMNSVQKEYLEKIIYLCQENAIDLVFVEVPKYHTVQDNSEYKSAMKEYTYFLQNKDVVIMNMEERFDNTQAAYFQDNVHLSAEGRREFTQMLCNELMRRMEE